MGGSTLSPFTLLSKNLDPRDGSSGRDGGYGGVTE